jgi:hypothetical protein
MRLLNIRNLKTRWFMDDNDVPPYAILSHIWESDEVTFQQIGTTAARSKAGYSKIEFCCKQAMIDGLEWAWIDT